MLCFTFLVAFVAINQSLANPTSENHPNLYINRDEPTRKERLGSNFSVTCAVIVKNENDYEPRWQMKDNNTSTGKTASLSVFFGWNVISYLTFENFKPENAGKWTCDLWSLKENKLLNSGSVDLVVSDEVSSKVTFEKNETEYRIKKGQSITWTIVIETMEPIEHLNVTWYSPTGEMIDPKLIVEKMVTESSEEGIQKRNFTLSNVNVNGTYKAEVFINNEKPKWLNARVSFTSDTPDTTSKPTGTTTNSPLISSGIRIESSFLALVAAWFACRSVAFGTTAMI